jgi:hypothetical protein
MFSSPEDLLAAKQNRAVYASMPFRGLDELVEVMARTRAKTELDVFSSMQAYQDSDRQFAALYAAMGRNPRIRHHGGVGQQELARQATVRAHTYMTQGAAICWPKSIKIML